MKLSVLFKRIQHAVIQMPELEEEMEIRGITCNSQKAEEDSLFVCIQGSRADGHDYIEEACNLGASCILIEKLVSGGRMLKFPENVAVVLVKDTREALAGISRIWFGSPADKLKVIGVTGTKGKSTVAVMIWEMLESIGQKCGLIGTIGHHLGNEVVTSQNTTPDAFTIQSYFAKMVEAGCRYAVMEVSSQGLKLDRTAGIMFDIGVFTNLEPDHIGPNEHASFEEYLECKAKLFTQCKTGIVNADDKHTKDILKGAICKVESYGVSETADIRATDVKLLHEPGKIGLTYKCQGLIDMDVALSLPGMFSVYNSLCAIAVTRHFNVNKDTVENVLKDVRVKGRIELVKVSDKFTLMIDYAHNAMSLESILKTLKEYHPHRLVCLFGCGGNRSKERRFEMGEVSGKYADLTVITSDNPRFEEPEAIIEDIKTGISRTDGKHIDIVDRKEAIKYVIEHGEPGDIIVLAGKGHEDYQEIKGVKYPMDERVLIAEVLDELKEKNVR